jgi:putative ABC transport system permease protein
LRLQNGRTKRFTTVPFRYAGVAKEFPTAPTDSFLIANADYIAQKTGSNAVGAFLVQTDGTPPKQVAAAVRRVVGTSARVTDIQTSRRVVGSNLTALVLAAAASGLTLGLGLQERRRTFAIAAALGARPRQLGGFVWSESAFVTGGGLVLGAIIAAGIARMLVSVLTGVFDPPPDALAIPWGYLLVVTALVVGTVAAAGTLVLRALRRSPIEVLRDL